MNRRTFVSSTLAAGAALFSGLPLLKAQAAVAASPRFKLGYGPHPGMFKESAGPDVLEQIKFAAAQGFTAWEDNGIMGRPPAEQEAIGRTLAENKMQMGVFVAYANFDEPTFANPSAAGQEEILKRMHESVEVAKRCGAKWFTVVPGTIDQASKTSTAKWGSARLAPGFQEANVVELLRRCAAILEPSGVIMVLEPLNWYRDHGGVWLQHPDQAYAVCKAVRSPSCKILFDMYHQQISDGNIMPNMDRCWDEIAYFQVGDNPGRNEPGTGEMNYHNIFRHIHAKGFTGVVGMEHGNSIPGKEGEQAVIKAYRDADDF